MIHIITDTKIYGKSEHLLSLKAVFLFIQIGIYINSRYYDFEIDLNAGKNGTVRHYGVRFYVIYTI